MTRLWFYKPEFEICAYVFDSHRPFCHKNINDPLNKILIIHDGCKSFEKCPNADDARIYDEILTNQDEEDLEDDFESDFNSDEEEAKQELEELKDESDNETKKRRLMVVQ